MELFPDLLQDRVKGPDVDLTPEFVEDLHEPAHVRPLELVGQADVHVDRRVHRLGPLRAVHDDDGVLDPLHPHLSNVDVPVVLLALDVDHGL